MDREGKKELRVFKKFAKVCPYPIDFDSIEKREPPEPDIFCKFRDGSPIAFEMSECIDEGIARSIFDPLDLKRALDTELEKLPNKKKQRIKTNFSDAVISVAFGKGISKDKKRSSIKTIFDYLLTLKNWADGEFDLKSQPSLKGIVRRISIKRGFDSLSFDIEPEAIWFSNPVVERIKTKFFDKTYKPKCNRVELLCYYELQPELPVNRLLPEVKNFLEANLRSSIFQRVWIYSVTHNKIIYVYPDLQKSKEIQKRIDYDLKKEGLQKKMPNKLMNHRLSSKEKQFHAAMVDIYRRAKSECKYNATYFIRMVSEHGGFEAAKRLLGSGDLVQSGFFALKECGYLHLSMEALVLKPEFRQLFTEEELMIAENRLREHDYEMQEYTKSLDINSEANNDNKDIYMPNLDDICWAAVTFRDQAIVLNIWRGNLAYSDILGEIDFLETLRYHPQDLDVNQVRSLLVWFLNKWGCRLRDDNVTASNLKSCIVDVHPELSTIQQYSIFDFDFEDVIKKEIIENIFNRFARNFGPTPISKTLHIINPNLFTMWDKAIRDRYRILNNAIKDSGRGYCSFLIEIKRIAEGLVDECSERFGINDPALWLSRNLNLNPPLSLVKFIDEFNWLAYTRNLLRPPDWVCPF